jgi:hypothetical protein
MLDAESEMQDLFTIVSAHRAPNLVRTETLHILTAFVFGTTIEESLYKQNSRNRKNGVALFKSIDCN